MEEMIHIGGDGHRCHSGPSGNFIHAFVCPTGEHLMGWQHPGGPHKMCTECGTGPTEFKVVR